MPSPRNRPRAEIARAVHRLTREELHTLEELAPEFGVSTPTLQRWIVRGKRGIWLDGFHRPGRGWLTSRDALRRFQEQVRERE